MGEFIKSLALCLKASGLSPRAISLFNQAKSASNFSWGNKAKLVAGACLAIALRESNRPDALADISSVLGLPHKSVARGFTSVTTTLGLSMSPLDPSVYIPNLQTHLTESLSNLSPSLAKSLETLCLRTVAATAVALSHLLIRLGADHDILRLPVPATACGIFVLALEAEIRGPFNPLGDLAQCLGHRYQVSKSVVMARYKTLQDEVALWVEEVPWLEKYRSYKGRAKVSKRLVVARGLKDVIKFQADIWQRRFRPILDIELTEEERDNDCDEDGCLTNFSLEEKARKLKVPKTVLQAQKFLLDPISSPLPWQCTQATDSTTLTTYLLLNSSNATKIPTRLQLLASLRGGATEDKISDDELFLEGELDKLLRSDEEIEVLRNIFGWPEGEENEDSNSSNSRLKAKRKYLDDDTFNVQDGIYCGSALGPRKKSRLDVEALAEFMNEDHTPSLEMDGLGLMDFGAAVEDSEEDDANSDEEILPASRHSRGPSTNNRPKLTLPSFCTTSNDGEVVLVEWRPPSPGSGVCFNDSCYEEEYD